MEWAQSALKDYEQAQYWYEQFQKKNLSEAFNSQDFRITEKMRNFAEISSKLVGRIIYGIGVKLLDDIENIMNLTKT